MLCFCYHLSDKISCYCLKKNFYSQLFPVEINSAMSENLMISIMIIYPLEKQICPGVKPTNFNQQSPALATELKTLIILIIHPNVLNPFPHRRLRRSFNIKGKSSIFNIPVNKKQSCKHLSVLPCPCPLASLDHVEIYSYNQMISKFHFPHLMVGKLKQMI